ncbi:hypothetical protein [uncultured Draconibacterium sp.]|uniref:hypothetical protein n=1 Tax=uncultured Draconibacterium sp. TaxID=1573823 RepID=UPI0032169A47
MQSIKSVKNSFYKVTWRGILFLLIGLVLLAWLISIAIAPIHKTKELQNLVASDSVFIEHFDKNDYHPELVNLVKQKTYKEALLKLSENDSIQLVLNLSDSTINLSIKGVAIHQTKIEKFKKDKFFSKLSLPLEIKLLSQPIGIQSQYATIVKEPIVVSHAPKDTLEAALNVAQPDTLIQNPAFVVFTLEHDLQIILEQDKCLNSSDKWAKFGFYKQLYIKTISTSAKNFFNWKPQEYIPTITLKIPVDDLRAIYRALPNNTFIVLAL